MIPVIPGSPASWTWLATYPPPEPSSAQTVSPSAFEPRTSVQISSQITSYTPSIWMQAVLQMYGLSFEKFTGTCTPNPIEPYALLPRSSLSHHWTSVTLVGFDGSASVQVAPLLVE